MKMNVALAQLNRKIVVPEKSAGQKRKNCCRLLQSPQFATLDIDKICFARGFRYLTKHRLLTRLMDMEALAILEAVRRVRNCGFTTLPTHHKGFESKQEVLFVQSKYFIHLSIRG